MLPRVLLLNSPFLIYNDIISAFEAMGVPYQVLNIVDAGSTERLISLTDQANKTFCPDFALTINHYGVDYEGEFLRALETFQLPLASWFVDSAELSLHDWNNLVSSLAALFTIDADSVSTLREAGHPVVKYLPLGSNPARFNPAQRQLLKGGSPSRVCFVGNTWMREIGVRLKRAKPTRNMLLAWRAVAQIHRKDPRRPIADILQESYPEAASDRAGLESYRRHMYDVAVAFEGTRAYRLECVKEILPACPVVVGNASWKRVLPEDSFLWMESVSYDTVLPALYPRFDVNFNCTCPYFTGAVNQRAFDIPASGAFVLSDHRSVMDELFDPETESAVYTCIEEIGEKLNYYLTHDAARQSIATQARRRVLMEHTYEHRLRALFRAMNGDFGTPCTQ